MALFSVLFVFSLLLYLVMLLFYFVVVVVELLLFSVYEKARHFQKHIQPRNKIEIKFHHFLI